MSQKLVSVVSAVQVVDAFRRKPEEYKTKTFFSEYDIWHYIPKFDRKLCDQCLKHAMTTYFVGRYLRGLFPHLKILDANTIGGDGPNGTGLVHPNCRCKLTRITDPAEYLMVTRELF